MKTSFEFVKKKICWKKKSISKHILEIAHNSFPLPSFLGIKLFYGLHIFPIFVFIIGYRICQSPASKLFVIALIHYRRRSITSMCVGRVASMRPSPLTVPSSGSALLCRWQQVPLCVVLLLNVEYCSEMNWYPHIFLTWSSTHFYHISLPEDSHTYGMI